MAGGAEAEKHGDVLAGLRRAHPRLLATVETWRAVRERRPTDPLYDAFAAQAIRQAETAASLPPITRVMVGRRLLDTSREALRRLGLHAAAYHLSGDSRFVEAARREMLAAANFSDWNPSHFLDTAEMTAALAIGYDWLHEALDEETRARVRAALVRHGLQPALSDDPELFFYRARNNWNQVCLGGLALGALAIAEDEPELAREILSRARRCIVNGLSPYAPDGVYPEGPGYWDYGTSYQVLLIEAVRTALGTDWDMPAAEGFLASSDFIVHMTGPTGLFFNFADSGARASFNPVLLWFARERRAAYLGAGAVRRIQQSLEKPGWPWKERTGVFTLLWWPPTDLTAGEPPTSFWHGRGANPVAAWRTAWNEPNATYVAIKGGGAAVNHGHMDAGSFVLDAGGVRWAEDLERQDYHSLEKAGVRLWDGRPGGQRWEVFRLNNHSHNTLTIDGQLHRADALATFTRADAEGAEIDLSPVFHGQATRVRRAIRWKGVEGVEIEDRLEGVRPGGDVRWALVTGAAANVGAGTIRLSQGGRGLDIVFDADRLRPAIESVEKPGGFNEENPGRRRIELHAKADAKGEAVIRVTLKPR